MFKGWTQVVVFLCPQQMRMTQLDTAAAEEEEEFEEEEGDEDEEGADEAENEGENPAEDGQEEEEKQENDSEDEDMKDDDDDDDEAEKESNDEKDEKESSEEEGSSGEESASDEDEDDGWRIAAKQRNGYFSKLLEMDVTLETHEVMINSNLLHPRCMVLMHVHTVQKEFFGHSFIYVDFHSIDFSLPLDQNWGNTMVALRAHLYILLYTWR